MSAVKKENALCVLTDPEIEKQHPLVSRLWLAGLFLIGAVLWAYFFNFGDIPFDFHDWAEVNAPRLAFMKDAVTKGELPLHMPDGSALRNVTDRYMALPDIILTPHVILLRWLSVGDFFVAHILILYTIGFAGLLQLKKYLNLSLVSFSFLFLIYYFNGHNLSHFSVGHCTWGGNLLFSWFIYLVFLVLDGRKDWQWTAAFAFLMLYIFLQGSFHQFVWIVLFSGVLAVTNWRTFFPILRAGVFGCLLSMVRIIPPALQIGGFDDDFLGGYRTPLQLVKALVRIISPEDSLNSAVTGTTAGWWECDTFIGFSGTLLLTVMLIYWLTANRDKKVWLYLLFPMAALSIFSIRNVYELFRAIPIPIFSGERVSSRFLILPLLFGLVLAVYCLQDALKKRNFKVMDLGLCGALFIWLSAELWTHLDTWKVTSSVKAFPYTRTDLSIKIVSNHPDKQYTDGLLIGLAITVLTALVLLLAVYLERRKQPAK